MTFDIVVVVYNLQLNQVKAISAFRGMEGVSIYVCDNSTNAEIKDKNKPYAAKMGVQWLDMGGNVGLARAYNSAIASGSGNVVCIFDDDTLPPETYLSRMEEAIEVGGTGCYLPLVRSGETLLSPLRRRGPAITRVENPLAIPEGELYAFNTGMAVTRDVYNRIVYDENLFIDYVDHSFMRSVHGLGIPVHVVGGIELQQNYSRQTDDLASALRRDVTFRCDVRKFHSAGGILETLYCEMYLFYRLLRNTLHFRTTAFIRLRRY